MYKIKFPAGYDGTDAEDDNIDTHVVLDTGQVFFATLFTLKNIERIMTKRKFFYFRAEDMVIVKDLKLVTIHQVVDDVIKEEMLNITFCEIGNISKIYGEEETFDSI